MCIFYQCKNTSKQRSLKFGVIMWCLLCDKRIVLFQEWFIELNADKKDLFSLSFTARPFSATVTVQVYHVTPAFINHRKDSFLVKSAELKGNFMQKKLTHPARNPGISHIYYPSHRTELTLTKAERQVGGPSAKLMKRTSTSDAAQVFRRKFH